MEAEEKEEEMRRTEDRLWVDEGRCTCMCVCVCAGVVSNQSPAVSEMVRCRVSAGLEKLLEIIFIVIFRVW